MAFHDGFVNLTLIIGENCHFSPEGERYPHFQRSPRGDVNARAFDRLIFREFCMTTGLDSMFYGDIGDCRRSWVSLNGTQHPPIVPQLGKGPHITPIREGHILEIISMRTQIDLRPLTEYTEWTESGIGQRRPIQTHEIRMITNWLEWLVRWTDIAMNEMSEPSFIVLDGYQLP